MMRIVGGPGRPHETIPAHGVATSAAAGLTPAAPEPARRPSSDGTERTSNGGQLPSYRGVLVQRLKHSLRGLFAGAHAIGEAYPTEGISGQRESAVMGGLRADGRSALQVADEIEGHRSGVPVHPDQTRRCAHGEQVFNLALSHGGQRCVVLPEQTLLAAPADEDTEEDIAFRGTVCELDAGERTGEDRSSLPLRDDESEAAWQPPDGLGTVPERHEGGR